MTYEIKPIGGGNFISLLAKQGWWDIINFSIIFLALIAIILVLFSKEKTVTKVLNILFISFIPPIGIIYYGIRLWYLHRKKEKELSMS